MLYIDKLEAPDRAPPSPLSGSTTKIFCPFDCRVGLHGCITRRLGVNFTDSTADETPRCDDLCRDRFHRRWGQECSLEGNKRVRQYRGEKLTRSPRVERGTGDLATMSSLRLSEDVDLCFWSISEQTGVVAL